MILTAPLGIVVAARLLAAPIYCAWGLGDTAWDSVPVPPAKGLTALEHEVGRRLVNFTQYCIPDSSGSVVMAPTTRSPTGKWSTTTTPSPALYLRTLFLDTDSPGITFREVGWFADVVLASGLPGGTTYFVPANVTSIGHMIGCNRFPATTRAAGLSTVFETVLDFA